MTVYIATANDGFYLIDAYGSVADGVWFSHIDDCLTYCEDNQITVMQGEK